MDIHLIRIWNTGFFKAEVEHIYLQLLNVST